MSIEGKVAIVTGASSGIGYATAIALSKAGAKVAIGASRTDKMAELETKIQSNEVKFSPKSLMLHKRMIVIPLLIR